MDVGTMKLEDFLNDSGGPEKDAAPVDFESYAVEFRPYVGEKITDLGNGYALHRLGADPGNVALREGERLVGFYSDKVVLLAESARGKGLSTPLILEASKTRPPPPPRNLTIAGRAALTAAWREAQKVISP